MPHPVDHIIERIQISPELEQSIRDLVIERRYNRGDTISRRLDMRNYTFYIQHGAARVYYIAGGREHTFSFAIDDQFVSLANRLLNTPDSVMVIEFLEPTTVLFIPHAQMHATMEEFRSSHNEEMSLFVITALLEHQKILEERLIMLQTANAVKRFEWFQRRYPRILERATITQIASFLGVTKETLYRIRSGKYIKK